MVSSGSMASGNGNSLRNGWASNEMGVVRGRELVGEMSLVGDRTKTNLEWREMPKKVSWMLAWNRRAPLTIVKGGGCLGDPE